MKRSKMMIDLRAKLPQAKAKTNVFKLEMEREVIAQLFFFFFEQKS